MHRLFPHAASFLILGIFACDRDAETGDPQADTNADSDTDTDTDVDTDTDTDVDTDVDTGPTDADGDGWTVVGGDCDDGDPDIHPGAQEAVNDGVDQDCDGIERCFQDVDGDGYGTSVTVDSDDLDCADPGESGSDTDCDDGDPEIHPGVDEVCGDGVDQDCNGADLRCGSWGTIDLSETWAKLVGDGGEFAGCSVAVGDLDDDGFGDVLIGADHANDGGSNAGMACVVFGPAGGTRDLALADARLVGEDAGDAAGIAVATVDTDGNGVGEILVGSWHAGLGRSFSGVTYLVLGPVGPTLDLAEADARLVGEGAYALAGSSVAGGDVDGDGAEEILVGAYQEDEGGTHAGAAYVILGSVSGTVDLAFAEAKLVGEEVYDYAGTSVAAGDLDGDGVEDVLVGARGSEAGGPRSGAVYIVHGPVSGTIDLSVADGRLVGETGDAAGTSVAAGDIDNDGLDDVIVGAPASRSTYLVLGSVEGSTSLSEADARLLGEAVGDAAGASVAAGDLDGDGVDELIVGAFFEGTGGSNAGAVYAFLGLVSGIVDLASADAKLVGEQAGDQAGSALATGDVDGDGAEDVLVGANGQDAGGIGGGAVYVHLGGGT